MEFFRKDIIPNNTTIYIGGPEMLKRPTTIKVYCFGIDNKEIEMFITKGKVAFIYDNQEKLEFTYDEFKDYCEKIKETIDPFIVFAYEFYACEWYMRKSGCKDWKIVYPQALKEAKENTKVFIGKRNKNINLLDRVVNIIDLMFMAQCQ